MSKAYSLVIHLPDGEPDGIRKLTKHGWSGVGLVIPRSKLAAAITQRTEFDRPGVYVLSGREEGDELPRIYVGEGNPVVDRLKTHQAGSSAKDFWDRCVFFTANDESLNKAHIQFLEARLHARAAAGKRCVIDNIQTPKEPALNEVDHADGESFLEQMLTIFPLVEITAFRDPASDAPCASANDVGPPFGSDEPLMRLDAKQVEAKGRVTNEGFIVQAGSGVVPDAKVTGTCAPAIQKLRQELLDNGVLEASDGPSGSPRFASAYEFNSPSQAACLVLGGTVNGRNIWKDSAGRSLNQREADAAGV